MGLAYIYKLTDTRNGKIYIGQHNGSDKNYFTSGVIPNRIVKKNKKEVFKKDIIVEGDFNKNLINELEKHYIRLYASNISEIGYNLTNGGEPYQFNESVLLRMSKAQKGIKCSPEAKIKLSI